MRGGGGENLRKEEISLKSEGNVERKRRTKEKGNDIQRAEQQM